MRRRTSALTEPLSRGAITVLRALLVCTLGGPWLAGCGSADPTTTTVVVQVKSLTTTANKLVVQASLDSKPAMQNQEITGDLSHFGVRLPATTTGSLKLAVDAFDGAACRIASGSTDVTVGPPYRFETTVTMQTLSKPECPGPTGPLTCSPATFCWAGPLPQGNAYLGLWVTSTNDAWAVGPVGTIAHYNGTSWSIAKSGITTTLRSVWAATTNDVWAVGDAGTILHYDGQTWQPSVSGSTQTLNSVWGDGTNIWAVGQTGTILRYPIAAKAWNTVAAGVTAQLNGVWAQSPSAVFAVGVGGTIVKFDGSSWVTVNSGTTVTLYGVGGDATQVYAVGDGGAVQKYNGTAFTNTNMTTGLTLYSVWSPATGQFIAVGSGGTVLRSTGAAWSVDGIATNTKLNLNAVRNSGTSPLWVAGDGGTLLSFTGSQWIIVTGGKNYTLRSLYGFAANDIWAVGENGTALHYDGTNWTTNNPPGVLTNLNGVWGSGPFDIWVVGDNRIIRRWNGTAWSVRMPADPDATNLNGIWGASATDIWIAANTGKAAPESHVMHISISEAKEYVFASNGPTFDGVWGSSNTNVWAVGSSINAGKGIAMNIVNNVSMQPSGLPTRMRSVWGTSAQDIWAVGDGGVQMHWDGTTWIQAATRTAQNLNGVWGLSTNSAWAVGDQGTLLVYDGQSWTAATESGTRNSLLSLWGSSAKDLWAVGFAGSILRAQK